MSGEREFAFTTHTIRSAMDEVESTMPEGSAPKGFDSEGFDLDVRWVLIEALRTARNNGEITVAMKTEGEN
jgi:hypothetical protein